MYGNKKVDKNAKESLNLEETNSAEKNGCRNIFMTKSS